jgi:hypothetical protein
VRVKSNARKDLVLIDSERLRVVPLQGRTLCTFEISMHVISLNISKNTIMILLYECSKISWKHLTRLQGNILTRQKRRTETLQP